MAPRLTRRGFLGTVLAALSCAAGCSDSSPSGPTPTDATGTSIARGTERLAWTQEGYASWLKFRAYVDDQAVDLPGASCDSKEPAECRAPLPPLTNGRHTIALANVMPWGTESARTAPIIVERAAAASTGVFLSLPTAATSGRLRLETVVTLGDSSFKADLVATDVQGPAQLAWVPDGRLLVADAVGTIRLVHPGESEPSDAALTSSQLPPPTPTGALGVTAHFDFVKNGFVYVSFIAEERTGRSRLRVVRLREVGGNLGEPATLFEAPLTLTADTSSEPGTGMKAAPRMAFGPDRLLYVLLPQGVEFSGEPAASTPQPAMVRLSDSGAIPSIGPLDGVDTHPLGFAWHPSTGVLWLLTDRTSTAVLRPLDSGRAVRPASLETRTIRIRRETGRGPVADALRLGSDWSGAALLAASANRWPGVAKLLMPVWDEPAGGEPDLVGDIVAGAGGALFVATQREGSPASHAGADVVVRLTPIRSDR